MSEWKTEAVRALLNNPKKSKNGEPCYVCSKHAEITELHHVVSVSELTKLLNNKDLDLEELETPVVWLCPNCHAYLHKIKSFVSGSDVRISMAQNGYSRKELELLYNILQARESQLLKLTEAALIKHET